jgi:rod shape-determining protein MreC
MWRRSVRDRFFIGFLVLATVAVLTLDFRTGMLDGVAGAVAQVVGVFQSGVRTIARPIGSGVGAIGDLASLRSENARLRRQLAELERQGETYTDVARENARLRSSLQLSGGLGIVGVQARVIGASLSGLVHSATIDKGRTEGVVPDKAVLGPEGLVGRVVSAAGRTATVLLLTDPKSAIGVRIGETGETGILKGTGASRLELELVSRAALDQGAVKRGDVVVTSGYQGGIFPPGVPIGRVDEVQLASRGTTYQIHVRPFARLSELDILTVAIRAGQVIEPEETPAATGGG